MPSSEPDPALAVLADCHLPIETGHPAFVSFLEDLTLISRHYGTVVLLGDLFQVWAPGTVFDHENGHRLVETIRALPGRTVLVEGNWDFFLERRLSERVEAHERHVDFTLDNGLWIALTHGHLDTGLKDRLWMALLKSAPSRTLFSTRTAGAWLGRRLNDTFVSGEFSKSSTDDTLALMVRRLIRRFPGRDRIICGHVHRAVVSGPVTALPDYYGSKAFLGLSRDGTIALYRVADGTLVPADDIAWYRIPVL